MPTPQRPTTPVSPQGAPVFPLPHSSDFEARLSMPLQPTPELGIAGETAASVEALSGYKQLISAACYLSLSSSGDLEQSLEPVLEAIQILHDCSQEMLRDGLSLGPDAAAAEDKIWSARQERWERRYLAGAVGGVDAPESAKLQAARLQRAAPKPAHVPVIPGGNCYCKDCKDYTLKRASREGFLMRKVMPLLGLYPWECAFCRKTTMLRRRHPATAELTKVVNLPWQLDTKRS